MAYARLVQAGVLSSQLHAFSFAFSLDQVSHSFLNREGVPLLIIYSSPLVLLLKGAFGHSLNLFAFFLRPFGKMSSRNGGRTKDNTSPQIQSKSTHVPPRLSSHNDDQQTIPSPQHPRPTRPRTTGHHDGSSRMCTQLKQRAHLLKALCKTAKVRRTRMR